MSISKSECELRRKESMKRNLQHLAVVIYLSVFMFAHFFFALSLSPWIRLYNIVPLAMPMYWTCHIFFSFTFLFHKHGVFSWIFIYSTNFLFSFSLFLFTVSISYHNPPRLCLYYVFHLATRNRLKRIFLSFFLCCILNFY
jgi:hypothetical protein